MVQAGHLVNGKTIQLVEMKGAVVYNVALEDNGIMVANNILAETLDPDNIIVHLTLFMQNKHVNHSKKVEAMKTMKKIMDSENVNDRGVYVKRMFSIFKECKKINAKSPNPPKSFKI